MPAGGPNGPAKRDLGPQRALTRQDRLTNQADRLT